MFKRFIDLLESLPMTILSGVLLLPDMISHLNNHIHPTSQTSGTLSFLPFDLVWIVILISGTPIAYHAIDRLLKQPGLQKISSELLITIAMIAAIIIGDPFAAGEVAFIMAIGGILETATANRAKAGLHHLLDMAPTMGRLLINGEEKWVAAEEIQIGDHLRVLPGESIPVDATIIDGSTSVDQSVMTGESLPIDKTIGDTVFSGTVNRFGAIDIKADKVGANSSLQKLIQMVQEAEAKQAPMQRIADRWASYLVPASLTLALLVYLFAHDLVKAVTILVVFCPCALVLATPTAIMAGIGNATKRGIIIKSGEALERMGKVDIITFDKTGTLTYGKLRVSDIIPLKADLKPASLLQTAASLEAKSEHPLGKAIVDSARKQNLTLSDSRDFKMFSGKGVSGKVDGQKILLGNEKFLAEAQIHITKAAKATLEALRLEGKASILVASEQELLGLLALADTLRPAAKAAIDELHDLNTNTILLTGDNHHTATYFAKQIGIDQVLADLLPADKVSNIEALQDAGHTVCMIGDGVNDAPALKTANVSLAMGEIGSDIAIDAADIALMNDDINRIPYLKRLSVATVKTIKISITLSMSINLIAVLLTLTGHMTPTLGALVHNAGSCLAVLVAGILYDRNFEKPNKSNAQALQKSENYL